MRNLNKILKIITAVFASIIFNSNSLIAESNAENTIQKIVNEVKESVSSHEGSDEELDKKLLKIIKPVFDFREMSRRSLGSNWRNATPEEQNEFTELFSDLLSKNYLKQIRDNARTSDFKVTSSKEEGIRAFVQTVVKTPKEEIKIDYRLYNRNKAWKVYDVVIENIGLVSNYRSEFANIVNKDGMKGLISQLKEKLKN